jgi:hypothetical protein
VQKRGVTGDHWLELITHVAQLYDQETTTFMRNRDSVLRATVSHGSNQDLDVARESTKANHALLISMSGYCGARRKRNHCARNRCIRFAVENEKGKTRSADMRPNIDCRSGGFAWRAARPLGIGRATDGHDYTNQWDWKSSERVHRAPGGLRPNESRFCCGAC